MRGEALAVDHKRFSWSYASRMRVLDSSLYYCAANCRCWLKKLVFSRQFSAAECGLKTRLAYLSYRDIRNSNTATLIQERRLPR
jgi:hypothetical protein